jgi:hypothetical protein
MPQPITSVYCRAPLDRVHYVWWAADIDDGSSRCPSEADKQRTMLAQEGPLAFRPVSRSTRNRNRYNGDRSECISIAASFVFSSG